MEGQSYIKNAAILTATGLLLRAVGMVFRIYLAAKIGAEGMGLYQLIYTVYNLAITFATGGISILATRFATDSLTANPAYTKNAMTRVLRLSLALGLFSCALLYFTAAPVSTLWLCDERASISLKILAPSLPVMAVSAALRGYFMARRRVTPNAKAQIFEQLVRLGVVATLIGYAAPLGIKAACAAVVFGSTVSECCSWVYMIYAYKKDILIMPPPIHGPKAALLPVLAPIAASGYLSSILRTIENVMVPTCLTAFTHNREIALAQYGALKGMAMPVMFFPFSFLATLSTLLMPEIMRAHLKKEKKTMEYLISRVMLLTCIVSALACGIFVLFASEIGMILYKSPEIGFYIRVIGPLMPLMYLESVVDGILKGLDEQLATFRYSVADSVIRIVLIFAILPRFGMQGFLFVMVVSNLFTGLLNLYRLFKVTKIKFNIKAWVVKPFLSVLICAIVKQFVLVPSLYARLPLIAWAILAISAFCVIYMIVLWLMGGYCKQDFLPKSRSNLAKRNIFEKK